MTPLRQRFIEDMQLRGYSARTQEAYARAVRQLAEHYHRSPDMLTEEELRQYFLYLANEKKWRVPARRSRCAGSNFSTKGRFNGIGQHFASCVLPTRKSCRLS